MRIAPSAEDLSATWRLLVVRAVIVLVLSAAALPWPIQSVTALLILTSSIALVAALFDAATSGALETRTVGAWLLFPEALIGVLLGGAVLLFPLASLTSLGVLVVLWTLARGILLAALARETASDAIMRMLTLGWATASALAAVAILVQWGELTILGLVYVIVAYALTWSGVELAIGLHLRARARARSR